MMRAYLQLMRFDKPIGTLLLLWPTLWSLWLAGNGHPHLNNIFIFIAGVVLMRAAGCVINDLADKKWDGLVERTQHRPLVTHQISTTQAVMLFLILCVLAFVLVLFTNILTIGLSFIALLVASIYPFMKRFTHWPQFFLGIAFSFSIPMAYATETNTTPLIAWFLMLGNLFWVVAYDTQYAMVDKTDDLKVGIKSTAVLFGERAWLYILLLQGLMLIILLGVGFYFKLSVFYYLSLLVAMVLMGYQYLLLSTPLKENYFKAFLNNQWVGLVIFLGIIFGK